MRTCGKAAGIVLAIMLAVSVPARAVTDRAADYLLKLAPRPAGMGGAFTAVPDDPIGLVWNPAAALRADRLAISGNHSLRHFPGDRKNLDQFDSDSTGIVIPVEGDGVLGLAFSVPGEWGVDYTDTNEVLDGSEKLRGRERRISYSDLHGARQVGAGFADSNWYRYNDLESGRAHRSFETGGGFSFFYEADNGMMYGVTVRGLLELIKGDKEARKGKCAVTLGAAYRPDANAATLAAADVELFWTEKMEFRWFAGVERAFDRRFFLRAGSMNGMPTYGTGARAGSLRLDYSIVKNLLPEVSGQDDVTLFQDGHFLSYTLSL